LIDFSETDSGYLMVGTFNGELAFLKLATLIPV